MIAVIQRVEKSGVIIDEKEYSSIGKGLLVLLGIKKGDTEKNAGLLAKKIIDLRIFQDINGKMNLSLKDIKGELLVISQFTLCTDNEAGGNRPSFTNAEEPVKAKDLYEDFIRELKNIYPAEKIKSGIFGAEMNVNLINKGPVTIILEK
ncbi:D-tyrosyl-tRNA(Tyr) deacylase [bacterium]|nr:MAG: D-tyrosyl-tRNA(Tyr) deacylase [bacterium]